MRNLLSRRLWMVLAVALAGGAATVVSATNYSLWINGRTGGGVAGNYADFSYWGPGSTAAGVNKKAVNWDGYNRISDQNYLIRNALDCYCTGTNWCYVAAHSAGDLMIGYTLSLYGGTSRYKKNATPGSDGTCANSDGGTQTGWNIKWVNVAAGAAGGSELANAGDWALSEPLVSDLKTGTARALYDHNNTRAKMFYMWAGAKGTAYSFVLPGQDDEVVAYHSSGGVSGSGGASYCNPSDWFCDDLTLGTAAAQGAGPSGATTRSSSVTTARPTTTMPTATGRAWWAWCATTWSPSPSEARRLAGRRRAGRPARMVGLAARGGAA